MIARERLNGSACFLLWRGSPAQTHPRSRESGRAYIEAHTPMFSFEEGLQALEGALAIGRQADPLGLDAVKVRFEAAQGQATRTTSVPDRHLLFKAKGWFESVSEAI